MIVMPGLTQADVDVKSAALALSEFLTQVKNALAVTDSVSNRCYKAGVVFPSEWQTYVVYLRSLLSSVVVESLPVMPIYPVNT